MERLKATETPMLDEAVSEAQRVRDLLAGARAYIRSNDPSTTVQQLISSARAGADKVVDLLERAIAVNAERESRDESAMVGRAIAETLKDINHAQAAKHVGQEGGR